MTPETLDHLRCRAAASRGSSILQRKERLASRLHDHLQQWNSGQSFVSGFSSRAEQARWGKSYMCEVLLFPPTFIPAHQIPEVSWPRHMAARCPYIRRSGTMHRGRTTCSLDLQHRNVGLQAEKRMNGCPDNRHLVRAIGRALYLDIIRTPLHTMATGSLPHRTVSPQEWLSDQIIPVIIFSFHAMIFRVVSASTLLHPQVQHLSSRNTCCISTLIERAG